MSTVQLRESEKYDIARTLEEYHQVFGAFWEMAGVYWSDKCKTAMIRLSRNGKPSMFINPDFWESLSSEARCFIVCHECLHAILGHGIRNGKDIPGATPGNVNAAQDVTINEMLDSIFGISRYSFDDWSQYCWIATCFKEPDKVLPDQAFTYYLKIMIDEGYEAMDLMDEHDTSDDDGELDPTLRNRLSDMLSGGEREKLEAGMGGGYALGSEGKETSINFGKLTKNLKATALRRSEVNKDTFARSNRRYGMMSDLILPGPTDVQHKEPDKLVVCAFMDVSGSCLDNIPTFDRVREAFMKEPDHFLLRTFVFTTEVVEIHPLDKEIPINGGTSFGPIEKKLKQVEEEEGHYPDCVIVLTDGQGSKVKPKHPKRWIWLLSNGGVDTFINPESRRHFIRDVTY